MSDDILFTLDNCELPNNRFATKLVVNCARFNLFNSITFSVRYVDEDGFIRKHDTLHLEGDDFRAMIDNPNTMLCHFIKERLLPVTAKIVAL